MFNEIRWKFVVVAAILAMAVSLVSGGLSGIPLGVLVFRVLAGGVLFAVLAAGLNVLVAWLFPEILEPYAQGSETAVEDAALDDGVVPGSRVDIIMPAESPEAGISEAESAVDADADSSSADESIGEPGELVEAENGEKQEGSAMGDLDRFSGDFSDVIEESKGSSKKSADGPMNDQDPEEIAQAIHTVMTRDEKG